MNYAVTVKCNFKGSFTYRDDFNVIFDHMTERWGAIFPKISYELDSKLVLHAHAHMLAPPGIKYTDAKVKGWIIYIRRIDGNLKRWTEYIDKDPRNYDKLIQLRTSELIKQQNNFIEYD